MKKLLISFLALLLLLLPLHCLAATYTISETELTKLETNLSKLETINKSNIEQSQKLKKQLEELQIANKTQEQLLQTANESLQKYEAEVKAERQRLKMQRTIAYTICVLLVVAGR